MGRGRAVRGLDPGQTLNLRGAIQDTTATHGAVDLGFKMPWELPGLDLVFGSAPVSAMSTQVGARILPEVPIPFPCSPPDPQQEAQPALKNPRVMPEGYIFQRAVNFAEMATEDQLTQRRWDRALEKWYVIICQNKSCSLIGSDIHGKTLSDEG